MRAPVGDYVSPRRPDRRTPAARAGYAIRTPPTGVNDAIALREAEIVWDGPLASGAGSLTSGSGALSELAGDMGVADRARGRKTSPRTHRGRACELLRDGALARARREQDAAGPRDGERRLHSRRGGGRARITTVELTVRAQVPGSRPPSSSAWSNGRPISARFQTRCAATSRSPCELIVADEKQPRGQRACRLHRRRGPTPDRRPRSRTSCTPSAATEC